MKRILVLILFALLLALLAPQIVHALGFFQGEPPPVFEVPLVLEIALVGVLSTLITQGMKNRFPKIAGALAVLISALVSTSLSILTGVVNASVPVLLWPLLDKGLIALAVWLTSLGVYSASKGLRTTMAGR
jgi:hypothetical protein